MKGNPSIVVSHAVLKLSWRKKPYTNDYGATKSSLSKLVFTSYRRSKMVSCNAEVDEKYVWNHSLWSL